MNNRVMTRAQTGPSLKSARILLLNKKSAEVWLLLFRRIAGPEHSTVYGGGGQWRHYTSGM